MNVDTDLCLTLNREEAEQIRTALHIATHLFFHCPAPYHNPRMGKFFDVLHGQLADAGIELHPDTVEFETSIIGALRSATTIGYGMRGAPLDVFATRPSSGKSMLVDALMLEHLLTLPPKFMVDADFSKLEQRVLACLNPEPRKMPDVLMDDQSARHVALTASQTGLVNKPQAKGWIVQFNLRHGSIALANWAQVRELGLPQRSRNAAYRMLKARAKAQGISEDAYRVVPEGTPDGPEKDRGFYTAEFFTKHAVRQSQLGWNTSSVIGLNGTFTTAQAARNAIAAHVGNDPNRLRRYRVKWHPSHA